MIKTLITASAFALVAGAASAAPLSFGIETDYSTTGGVSSTSVTASVDGNVDRFVAGVKADVETQDLTGWYVGAHVGEAVLTYGDQDGVFSFGGGLNTVGGSILATASTSDRTLTVDGLYGFGVSVGLDTGTDVQNIQATAQYAGVVVGVDYDVDTKDYILGASYAQLVAEDLSIGGIITYDTDVAAELNASYATLGGTVNGFATVDTTGFDALGVGYDRELSANASAYVEGARDLNTDANTIAVGVSFAF